MGIQFAWFFDVALVGVVAAYIYLGGKRGFLRTLVLLIGYVVSLAGAYFISDISAPVIYEKFVKSKAEEIVAEKILDYSIKDQIRSSLKKQGITVDIPDEEIDRIINNADDISDSLSAYLGGITSDFSDSELSGMIDGAINVDTILKKLKDNLPDSIYAEVEEYVGTSTEKFTEIIKVLNNADNDERAKEITEILLMPFAVTVIRFIVFMLVFAVLMVIFRFISELFRKFYLIPIAGQINTLFGAVLGFGQGLFIIFVVTLVIKIIIAIAGNDLMVINEATIEKTKLFKIIYDFNLFT
ncbi:MAG: CvpA family protein [Oscillospiraceae bacterium]|jgi:hypothetical protein